jgi:aryl-alcohol dehydrogenase-like predicted oxidoreductase
MQQRVLGQTGEALSIVGFGGIVVKGETDAGASRLVAEAVDHGVNYFDVAPSYGDAQARLGPALKPYRQGVFLACKTTQRSRDGAKAELDESLRLLQTDHVDLYQFHAVRTAEDVEQICGPGGALETFLEAQRAGKTRFIGLSAHAEEAAIALLERAPLASVLYPINWVTWNQGKFGARLMAKALEKGAGILALKSLARRALDAGEPRPAAKCWYAPAGSLAEATLALRFTLSRPVTAAVCPSEAYLLRWAMQAAETFTPLSADEEAELQRQSAGLKPLFPL